MTSELAVRERSSPRADELVKSARVGAASGASGIPVATLTQLEGSPGGGPGCYDSSGVLAMTTDRIEFNPAVLQGKPVVRGTRIPVEGILRKLSEGATETDLLDAYPRLTRDDIQAVLRYAADSVAHEVIVLPHAE